MLVVQPDPPSTPERSAAAGGVDAASLRRPLRCVPVPSRRRWAGSRLGGPGESVGELWLAGPESIVESGPYARLRLDDLARHAGAAFVGTAGMRLLGPRFPLLVKLIDAADWLSLQVHPDDSLAAELHGPSALGKTEAWLILAAERGAELVTGPARGLSADELRRRIADGSVTRGQCEVAPAHPGESLLIRAGTLHAIGAGVFVYEIEQPSDLTFRVSDWGRPAVAGRSLHITEALRAIDPGARAALLGDGWRIEPSRLDVAQFRLEIVPAGEAAPRRPAGRSLEVVTALDAPLRLEGDSWSERLDQFGTLIVPAAVPEYRLETDGRAAIGSVP